MFHWTFKLEVNDRNVELIDDALGGINIENCDADNDDCKTDPNSDETVEMLSRNDEINNEIGNEVVIKDTAIKKKKYAFDVIDDTSVFANASEQHMDSIQAVEKDDIANTTLEDSSFHKRIVRVSLQRPFRKTHDKGMCFKGNDSFVFYDIHKIIEISDKHQFNINIRFKTNSLNGLLLLVSQKVLDDPGNFFALSIEEG